jgi:hypothetical protein
MTTDTDSRLPCAICGAGLSRRPELGCVAMTAHLDSMTVSKLVVCCRAPCLERHAHGSDTILCDEDLESYLGSDGAGPRARLVATFGWTEESAREYMAFARAAQGVVKAPARMAS